MCCTFCANSNFSLCFCVSARCNVLFSANIRLISSSNDAFSFSRHRTLKLSDSLIVDTSFCSLCVSPCNLFISSYCRCQSAFSASNTLTAFSLDFNCICNLFTLCRVTSISCCVSFIFAFRSSHCRSKSTLSACNLSSSFSFSSSATFSVCLDALPSLLRSDRIECCLLFCANLLSNTLFALLNSSSLFCSNVISLTSLCSFLLDPIISYFFSSFNALLFCLIDAKSNFNLSSSLHAISSLLFNSLFSALSLPITSSFTAYSCISRSFSVISLCNTSICDSKCFILLDWLSLSCWYLMYSMRLSSICSVSCIRLISSLRSFN
mmetsp:Transcript_71929/g.114561  ORF Transcript_71929/g.114561 Transcript_71929/m.114561 type:complete len:322 (-) Transcript_71929:41-1006(-)